MLIFRHIKKDRSKREKKSKAHYTKPKLLLLLPSHPHRLPHMHHQPLVFQPKNLAGSRRRGRRRRRYHVVYFRSFSLRSRGSAFCIAIPCTYNEGLSYRRPVGYRKRRRGGESRRSIGRSHENITPIVTWFHEQLLSLLLLLSSSSLRNSCVRERNHMPHNAYRSFIFSSIELP